MSIVYKSIIHRSKYENPVAEHKNKPTPPLKYSIP
jgi:hypothetical protein